MKFRILTLLLLASAALAAQKQQAPVPPVRLEGGKLTYLPDEKGNRVPDFSYCGYAKSEKALPFVPVKVIVIPKVGDATERIQSALDYVGRLPVDANGFRGAVLLQKGRYELSGGLVIRASGIVLRGSGMGADGTLLHASGTDRETVIRIAGRDDRQLSKPIVVTDSYLPVNALKLTLAANAFKPGDRIVVRRPSTLDWIRATGTESFGGGESALGWKPGNEDIWWNRTVTAVEDNRIQLDAPLTTDMDPAYATDTVYAVSWPGKISQCGVENLQLESTFDPAYPLDENHRWEAIVLENLENAWVRRVSFRHFAGSAVHLVETAVQVTVEDCRSSEPISEIGGYRRNTFLNEGQLNLIQRCAASGGFHDFAVGQCAAGPNAFVQCLSEQPFSFSGTLGSWASGVLFDNVCITANALNLSNRRQDGQGAGWSAANSVVWQCRAAVIDCPKPPMAQNWAFGNWSQFQGDGSWWSSSEMVHPKSLFYGQLAERLGQMPSWAGLMPEKGEASSSPSYGVAAKLTREARQPDLTLDEWIDSLVAVQPISLDATGAKRLEDLRLPVRPEAPKAAPMTVQNGWLVRGDQVVTGMRRGINWWNGNLKPRFTEGISCMPHLTRWVPGRTGTGFTDDLQDLTDQMAKDGFVATDHHYPLWYERRRDDHIHERRMDGDVWAPLYELPFARSGQGKAYDGLSRYDLTRWNSWYWKRLKTYADLADQKGLVLFNQNFFQHNIIEAGAHWADCPWRTANNINGTGFPEPVNFAGDKRIFFAEQFYDLSNTTRKALYRTYIRKCLDNFDGNNGVIQFLGEEYTGPKAFVTFWLDCISEWEKETGKHALVCLSCTKDVQDSILAQPKYLDLIDLIDTKYWRYEAAGKLYAPPGGMNLAPRQHDRLKRTPERMDKGLPPSARAAAAHTPEELQYWTVRDYRDRFQGKAVLFSSDVAFVGWPAFMAGGSVCTLPKGLPSALLNTVAGMKPMDSAEPDRIWLLGQSGKGYLALIRNGETAELDLTGDTQSYTATWLNPSTGNSIGKPSKVKGGSQISLSKPSSVPTLLWLNR